MGLRWSRDHWGGALMLAAGVAVAAAAFGYDIGSLRSMGSGFFPLVLGVLLALVGAAILVTTPPAGEPEAVPSGLDRRGAACILGGLLAFVALGEHGGLVPASFASVFIAAMGDRANRPRDALVLALVMTAFGAAVFHYGLRVLLPLFTWH